MSALWCGDTVGLWIVGYCEPPYTPGSLKRFYCIQSVQQLQDIHANYILITDTDNLVHKVCQYSALTDLVTASWGSEVHKNGVTKEPKIFFTVISPDSSCLAPLSKKGKCRPSYSPSICILCYLSPINNSLLSYVLLHNIFPFSLGVPCIIHPDW